MYNSIKKAVTIAIPCKHKPELLYFRMKQTPIRANHVSTFQQKNNQSLFPHGGTKCIEVQLQACFCAFSEDRENGRPCVRYVYL